MGRTGLPRKAGEACRQQQQQQQQQHKERVSAAGIHFSSMAYDEIAWSAVVHACMQVHVAVDKCECRCRE
jgi:hypothetical protein